MSEPTPIGPAVGPLTPLDRLNDAWAFNAVGQPKIRSMRSYPVLRGRRTVRLFEIIFEDDRRAYGIPVQVIQSALTINRHLIEQVNIAIPVNRALLRTWGATIVPLILEVFEHAEGGVDYGEARAVR